MCYLFSMSWDTTEEFWDAYDRKKNRMTFNDTSKVWNFEQVIVFFRVFVVYSHIKLLNRDTYTFI